MGLWEPIDHCQSLLKIAERLLVGGVPHRFTGGLMQVGHSLLPRFAPQRVVGEPVDLLGQPARVASLDGLQDPGVQAASPLVEQTTRFLAPAFVGDTIKPRHEVIELERKRSAGLLTLRVTLTNQRGETVLDGRHKYLIAYRPSA